MLTLVYRKMLNNKWLFLSLIASCILTVAMIGSIPAYTQGALQRMLTRDLEAMQVTKNTYPGTFSMNYNGIGYGWGEERYALHQQFDSTEIPRMLQEIGLPVKQSTTLIKCDYLTIWPAEQQKPLDRDEYTELISIKSMEDHITMSNGRWPSKEPIGEDKYEVIITAEAMKEQKLLVGREYTVESTYSDSAGASPRFTIFVTGVFDVKDQNDPFWNIGISYPKGIFMPYETFTSVFAPKNPGYVTAFRWFADLDYHALKLDAVQKTLETYDQQIRWLANEYRSFQMKMPLNQTIDGYEEREKSLTLLMWILMIPVLLMSAFFIYMVSQLIIQHERNELSLMKSRGAGTGQVFTIYLLQSLFIASISMAIGPFLSLWICRLLGASNGFMEFVNRSALPIAMSTEVYLYAAIAAGVFILSMLLPAISNSRESIVEYKRTIARKKSPFWKRIFLDVIILALSIYGLYRYQQQNDLLNLLVQEGKDIGIDPLLFVVSTFFILGCALFLLRIYPSIVKLIFAAGKRYWPPVLYAPFVQVGRSGGHEQFLMLFIIFALSVGILSANQARTINRNMEDKIRYKNGADVVIIPEFEEIGGSSFLSSPQEAMSGQGSPSGLTQATRYIEQPYHQFFSLDGVETGTRVILNRSVMLRTNKEWLKGPQSLMAITPNEFGKIAWFRNDLLSFHWYKYLNLMSLEPSAALVSRNFEREGELKVGDVVNVLWDKRSFDVVIYAFIDYWPGFNTKEKNSDGKDPYFLVTNYNYIQNKIPFEPYELWLKEKPGATDTQINKALTESVLDVTKVDYAQQKIIKLKNDPFNMGLNGGLTLGFLVTMAITMLGFLIYWVLSIQERTLQFGIFRAMGLKKREIFGMLLVEQVLVSLAAIVAGILIGGLTSRLFVPLAQIIFSAADQVPPFLVVAERQDYIRVYLVAAAMMLIGLIILRRFLAKLKIDQALKLGED